MGVPHIVVRREDFADYDLSEAGIVLINCAQYHEFCICPTCIPGGDKNNRLYKCTGCNKHIKFSAKLTEPEVKKLANFARSGGFLFCEDWVVQELLERAFPDIVSAGLKLKDHSVDVVPGRGMGSHPYLRGIFTPKPIDATYAALTSGATQAEDDDEWDFERLTRRTVVLGEDGLEIGAVKVKHTWTIDDESYALKIQDSRRVVPLLTSGTLQKIANGDGAVALAFRAGSGAAGSVPPGQARVPRGTPGVVVMVLSHFGKQASREDEFTIQNLLLNVLIDADRARRARLGG
jgi:hypothetical protein